MHWRPRKGLNLLPPTSQTGALFQRSDRAQGMVVDLAGLEPANLLLARQVLSQLSYRPESDGGVSGIRTRGLDNANVAPSQLSYDPTWKESARECSRKDALRRSSFVGLSCRLFRQLSLPADLTDARRLCRL